MLVYLAARFSRFDDLNRCREELTELGIEVTSRWLDGGHEWVGTPDDEIPVDELRRFATEDIDDILAADLVICFTEPPKSGPARGGRHFEAGFALAMGMPVLCVGYVENVFYSLESIIFQPTWDDALAWLQIALRTWHPVPIWAQYEPNRLMMIGPSWHESAELVP